MTFALEVQEAAVEHDRRDDLDDDPTPRMAVRAVLGQQISVRAATTIATTPGA